VCRHRQEDRSACALLLERGQDVFLQHIQDETDELVRVLLAAQPKLLRDRCITVMRVDMRVNIMVRVDMMVRVAMMADMLVECSVIRADAWRV
jgi:hypothetical protein